MTGKHFGALGLDYLTPLDLQVWLTVHRLHARAGGGPVTWRGIVRELGMRHHNAVACPVGRLLMAGLVRRCGRAGTHGLVPCPVRVEQAKGVGR